MHPRRLLIALAVVAVALGATVALARPTLAGNKRAARRDIRVLLARLNLPAGATPVSAEPRGDNGYLKPEPELTGNEAHADVHAWWTVPGDPESVYAYVTAHRPRGSTVELKGSGGNSITGTTDQSVTFSWRDETGVLDQRYLQVTVTALPGGDTGVLAQAEDDWVLPRPASEVVPAGATAVTVTVAKGAVTDGTGGTAGTNSSHTITDSATVTRAIRDIDSLPIAQPLVGSCPAEVGPTQTITLTFTAGAGGPALAVAAWTNFAGWDGDSGQCNAITFTVGTHQETPLIGGPYLRGLTRIFGRGVV